MSYDTALLHHVQRTTMKAASLSWEAVQLDEDDEICFLDEHDRMLTVELLRREGQSWVRAWLPAAVELKRSAKLLKEVNELNLALIGARALLVGDRLLIAGERLVETLEPADLSTLFQTLSEHAERVGELVHAVHRRSDQGRDQESVEP